MGVDRTYGRVTKAIVGQVQRKLERHEEVRCMVFGEASEEVHQLVQICAESRLSVASVRAQAAGVGRAAAATNKRRQAGEWREKRWAREKEAMMLDQAQDRMVVRRGQFCLD